VYTETQNAHILVKEEQVLPICPKIDLEISRELKTK
jgi:hypothetical protein